MLLETRLIVSISDKRAGNIVTLSACLRDSVFDAGSTGQTTWHRLQVRTVYCIFDICNVNFVLVY